MSLKKILKARPDIKKQVDEKYPRTKLERQGCVIEKAFRDAMRYDFAKKLIALTGKMEYDTGAANKAV